MSSFVKIGEVRKRLAAGETVYEVHDEKARDDLRLGRMYLDKGGRLHSSTIKALFDGGEMKQVPGRRDRHCPEDIFRTEHHYAAA